MEAMPRTLIHNDFNPRNIAIRPDINGDRLCAYDWELATLGVPQHDLAELLIFTLRPNVEHEEVMHYLDYHRKSLEQNIGQSINPADWYEGYRYALMDLAVNRIALYLMAHTFRHYGFMERVINTARRLARLEFTLE